MTVVSIRCQECDEVKREEKMAGIQVCKDCSGGDTPDAPDDEEANSDEPEVSNEASVSEEEISDESADSPNDDSEEEETDENAEREKKTLEESFTEQDPLDW